MKADNWLSEILADTDELQYWPEEGAAAHVIVNRYLWLFAT